MHLQPPWKTTVYTVTLHVMCVDYEERPVRLRLTDVNDEVPQFQNAPRPFLAMVSSDAPMGTSVYQLVAHDQDRNSLLQYSLESGKYQPNCSVFASV